MFRVIVSYVLEDRFGYRVQRIDFTKEMTEWNKDDGRRVGCAFAKFVRSRKTGDAALAAWSNHYIQLTTLFDEVEGFQGESTIAF